jgi:TfoX/Sxy family transcriptional regulator of competence genes
MDRKSKRPAGAAKRPVGSGKTPPLRRSSRDLVALLESSARSFPQVELRNVFGHSCGFVKGQMAFGLHREEFFIRLGEEDRDQLLLLEGAHHLEPVPGRRMREYVVLPEAVRATPQQLKRWLEMAVTYTAGLPPKPKKPPVRKRA